LDQHERHYSSHKLTIIFAVSCVILLLSIIWMFAQDYDRPWKKYQKAFRDLEIEKSRVKFDEAQHALEQNEEYKTLLAKLDQSEKDH